MLKYLLIGLAAVGGLACAAPPAQHFFEPAQFKNAKLSPSGRYVALRAGDSKLRDMLLVLDTETLAPIGGARHGGYDIADIRWVNDRRLVFNVVDTQTAPGDRNYAPGLYVIDRDGRGKRQLADHAGPKMITGTLINARSEPWNTYLLEEEGGQDSDYIYVRRPIWSDSNYYVVERTELVRLDTSSGHSNKLTRPEEPQGWMLDHNGEPALMVSEKEGNQTLHYRNPANGAWRALATFPAYGSSPEGMSPVGFMDDKRLLVKTRVKSDKAALHIFDLASGKLDPEALLTLTDFDFSGSLVYAGKRLAGVHYLGDTRASVWFDEGMQAAQTDVNRQLPGLVNILTPPMHAETPWMLVESYSDRQPDIYSLYNSKTKALKVIGGAHPDINAAEMGRQKLARFKARDGMSIPAWLTLPAQGGKKLPLVVLVHGGPYVRGTEWSWDSDSQFLASRGYAVLEPEFRGTTGYGERHFSAGIKQWGLKMQDDIADSVQWAMEQGHADPDRVCIMGGSYGGYAALMGLVNDHALYRCGIAYAAVTDIPLLLDSGNWMLSDMDEDYRMYGGPQLVGDPVQDAAQLAATSPLKQAARIKRPLLLAHGTDDRRVPLKHFTLLRTALQANKADAEYLEYQGEGHGWSVAATRVDFWTRVEQFLNKHIGNK